MNEEKNVFKCLSVRQPWAYCIVNGLKPVENRTWQTKYRGHILIHAGKTFDQEGFDWLKAENLIDRNLTKEDFPTGGIVGETFIINCIDNFNSPWFFGPYGFLLAHSKVLPFQEVKGKLGIFNVEYNAF